MLILLFLLPLIALLAVFVFLPQQRKNLNRFCAIAAFISLAAMIYAVNSSPLWKDGERIVWSGISSKSTELIVGGNVETASVGWANGAFSPKIKATSGEKQTKLEISGGGGFVRRETTNEYINGAVIEVEKPQTIGNYTYQKTSGFFCGTRLNISLNNNLLVQIKLPETAKDRVYNLDSVVNNATQNLTPKGEKQSSLFCSAEYKLAPTERLRQVEELKLVLTDARLLLRPSGEIRFLDSRPAPEQICENPCRIRILWSNSSLSAEFDAMPKINHAVLKFLPPYQNFSPLPKDAEAKQQLTVTNQISAGEFAYTLPLGKKESAEKRKLDLSQLTEYIPEAFEKVLQKPCEPPSCKLVEGENVYFAFMRVKDLPSFSWILIFSIVPFVLFLFGLRLVSPQPSPEINAMICCFVTAIWNFSVFRLLLAFRYALDPAYLDKHSIGDLTLAFGGLIFLPCLLFLLARICFDARRYIEGSEAKELMSKSLLFLSAFIIVFILEVKYVQTLWANLPQTFEFSLGWLYGGGIVFLFVYLFAHIFFLYFYKQGRVFAEESENPVSRILKFIFLGVWELPRKFADSSRRIWLDIFAEGSAFGKKLAGFALVYGLFVVAGFFVLGIFGKDFLPFIFCWIPVIFWLAAKSIKTDAETAEAIKKARWKIAILALLTFTPFFFLPLATSDAGSIYANFVILLMLACVLFKAADGNRIFGRISMSLIFIGIVTVFVFYLNFSSFIGVTTIFGEAVPRVLAFKSGDNFQHFILSSDAGSSENQIGLNVYDITNVYQHTWENKAIAREGGLFGLGFGNAPVRLSQIRGDTIQVDSVYSFYVVGDYGFIGGILLLLMYFVPLLIIFFGGRKIFGVGLSTALIICCAFLLEGLIHAAMNVGVAPLTGRNLPMLAVHSFNGDFLRWTVLFAFVINAIYWHYREDGEFENETVCLLTNEENQLKNERLGQNLTKPVPDANGKLPAKTEVLKYRFNQIYASRSEIWRQMFCLTFAPLLLLFLIATYGFIYVYFNDKLAVFSWNVLKEDIDWAISNQMLRVVQDESETSKKCPKIVLDQEKYRVKYTDEDVNNGFLNQQINRFNALSCEERIGEGVFPNITEKLKNVKNYDDYQNFMKILRETDEPSRRARKPNLLMVYRIGKEQREADDKLGFGVAFNPEFNISRTFSETQNRENFPTVKIGNNTKLFGWAWDKGKYVTALENTQVLSWTDWLAASMNLEWKRLGSTEAARKYGNLSLDEKLHNESLKFIDQKGIELHKQKIAASGNDWEGKLPSRIGLTVMKISGGNDNGAVLALGSFPRASGGNQWQKITYGQDAFWIPPAKIVEKRFPAYLRQIYGGDRNFEKVTVMGSSTKPMFAEAVSSVHLDINLHSDFKVSGSEINDNSVFGIKISEKSWKGHGSGQTWVDFNTFLTESNNRYQVLYGFLGLTNSKNNQNILPFEANPASGSALEMFGGKVLNKFPKFDENIGFNFKNSEEMRNLHKTQLAMRLRRMFGVGTFEREDARQTEDYSAYMNSFWTKDENHDALRLFDEEEKNAPLTNVKIQNNFSPAILPARANLRLNRIKNPRDFVTLLLGGGENRWSNIHAAAGFASAVTGRHVLPHIVKNDDSPVSYSRATDFVRLANYIKPGLSGVIFNSNGTANKQMKSTGAIEILQKLKDKNFQIYAKTGTLTEDGKDETSRIILAIVQFEDSAQTKIKKGLVFSLFVEETEQGKSAIWLGEFIVQNKVEILRLLETQITETVAPLNQPQKKKSKK